MKVITKSATSLRMLTALILLSLVAAACGSSTTTASGAEDGPCFADPGLEVVEAVEDPSSLAGTEITLATHDSFFLSEGTLEAFTEETGIIVEQIAVGDAGQLVSQSVLTAGTPTADVLFGIDNSFLCRGLEADIFSPFVSTALGSVPAELQLDPLNRVTPIDFGDVCVNSWAEELPGEIPATLEDLIDPVNANQFVTENPETSSPGFAFLLATIARFGEDGWEDYWTSLVDNGVTITAGWNDAYNGEFIAGGGERSLVTSYASSPPADFLFADPPVEAPRTGVLDDSCFRQIEFAGILAGTEQPQAAAALIDFMLSPTYQEDVPLNQFVYPANSDAVLPDSFVEFGPLVDDPLILDPAEIEANRDDWTERWNAIVLG